MNRAIGVAFLSSAIMLAGCGGMDSVQPDQEVTLQPGYGIAAVVMDTLDPLNAVNIKSPDTGVAMEISHVNVGVHMSVFVVPAGNYCLTKFFTGSYVFTQDDQTHGICFDVVPGKVAYSGNLAPRAYGQNTRTDQNYNWPAFEKMFKEQYPKLANYPIVTP